MKRRLILLLTVLAAVLAFPAISSAGCVSKVDTGQKPIYAGSTPIMSWTDAMIMDENYFGTNCTSASAHSYHTNAYMQQYYNGAWHESETYPSHYTSDSFTGTLGYHRYCDNDPLLSCSGSNDTAVGWNCFAPHEFHQNPLPSLVRMRIVTVDENDGSTATAASTSTAFPSTCQ